MSKTQYHLFALALAIVATIAVDWRTNRNPISESDRLYTTIAEDGLVGNRKLVAPYAYRFVWVYMAKGIAEISGRPLLDGFAAIAYASLVGLAYLAFVFALRLGASLLGATTILLTIALSFGHAKHTLYYRAGLDNLCQMTIVLFFLATLAERRLAAAVSASIGAILREFGVIMAVLFCLEGLREALRERSLRRLVGPALLGAVTAAIVLLPRLLIQVVASDQHIDPASPRFWQQIVDTVSDPKRAFNIVLGSASYLYPTLLLLTPARARFLRQRIEARLQLPLYSGLVLLLTLFGGTDITRFLTYLVVPQLVLLALLFRDDAPKPALWELGFFAVAFVSQNNTFALFPDIAKSLDAFLDFYPAFSSRITLDTAMFGVEILAALLGINLLRVLVRLRAGTGHAR